MKEETLSDALVRAFLLGKVDDDERERIESLFLSDSQEREKLLSAEQDLIEDYLEDNLTTEDKQRFVAIYAQTPEQQQKLSITKSIKDWASRETPLPEPAGTRVSVWSRLRTRLRLNPVLIIPIAVAAMIAIVIAVGWLNGRERSRRHLAIEHELAQLNTPASLHEVPPQMVALDLSPVAVRGAEQQTLIPKSGDVRIVELRLPWVQKDRYSSYQAEIRQVGNDESFIIRNLQGEDDRGYSVRLRLPAHLLDKGQYLIRLNGNNASGLAEEYLFAVND